MNTNCHIYSMLVILSGFLFYTYHLKQHIYVICTEYTKQLINYILPDTDRHFEQFENK